MHREDIFHHQIYNGEEKIDSLASFNISQDLGLPPGETPLFLVFFGPISKEQGTYIVGLSEGGKSRASGPRRSLHELHTGIYDRTGHGVEGKVFSQELLTWLRLHGLTVERYKELVEQAVAQLE